MTIHHFEADLLEVFKHVVEWLVLLLDLLVAVVQASRYLKRDCAFEVQVDCIEVIFLCSFGSSNFEVVSGECVVKRLGCFVCEIVTDT